MPSGAIPRSDQGRGYIKKVISVFIPVALQNLLGCAMGIVDTTMLGRLGVAQLAASGAASMVYIVMFNFMYGYLSGTGAFISQYWGIRDTQAIKRIMGVNYASAAVCALIFTAAAELFPHRIIWLIDRDPAVIEYGVRYLRVIAPSYILGIASYCVVFSARCVQRLRVCTAIDACAILLNTLLNYMFIWGKFGAPAWGVEGAAFATVLSRLFEFTALFIYVNASRDFPLAAKFSELFSGTAAFRLRIIKTALPVAFSDGLWGITCTVYLAAVGLIGTAALAAYQVINLVSESFQSIFYGLGNAAAVLIGEQLGQGDIPRARRSAVQFLWGSLALSAAMTAAMLLISPGIAEFYRFDPGTSAILLAGLEVTAWTIALRMITYVIMCGILRAGGDTKAAMYIDLFYNWAVIIPAMFACILLLKGGLSAVLLVCYAGEGLKGLHCFFRYRKGCWENVLTE